MSSYHSLTALFCQPSRTSRGADDHQYTDAAGELFEVSPSGGSGFGSQLQGMVVEIPFHYVYLYLLTVSYAPVITVVEMVSFHTQMTSHHRRKKEKI